MSKPAARAADHRVRRSDLDFIDQEIAELSSGVRQLHAAVVRNQMLGVPLGQSRRILDSGREKLEQLLRRRTTMFFAFVTGQ